MADGGDTLSDNPYFENGMILELLVWGVIDRAKADTMWCDPEKKVRLVVRSRNQYATTIARWQRQYQESGHRIALRWPHCVYPPLTSDEPQVKEEPEKEESE